MANSDKTPPAWTTEIYNDDNHAVLLDEWIKQKGGWQVVFDQLAQLDLKPYDESPSADIEIPGENGPVWADLEAKFFEKEPLQRWLSQEPSFSGTTATSRKQHDDHENVDSPLISSPSTSYTQQLGYDLGALLEYDEQNKDGCEMPISSSITSDDEFDHAPNSDGANNNGLFISDHDVQWHDNIPKATKAEAAKKDVERKASMYIDALAGIRRVNEYAGKRRRLDDLTDVTDNKQHEHDDIEEMKYNIFSEENQKEEPVVAADSDGAAYRSSPDGARLLPISPSACSDYSAKTMTTTQGKLFAPRKLASPLNIPSTATSLRTSDTLFFVPRNTPSHYPPSADQSTTTTTMIANTFQSPSIPISPAPAGKGKLISRCGQASTSMQTQHQNGNPRASPLSTSLEYRTTAFHPRHDINNNQRATVAYKSPEPFIQTASSFEQFLTATGCYLKKRSSRPTTASNVQNIPHQQQQQERSSIVSSSMQPLASSGNDWKLAGPSISIARGRGGFSAGANVSDFVAMRKLTKGNGPHLQTPARPPMHHQQRQSRNSRDNIKAFCELRGPYSTMDEKYEFDEET
ncbi:hypothetical protein BDB00DRAFT_885946 [Zychaea mexicana]|uniref:uncharacterized protein n=1 Tax=Zychaea mexicana TaxID=64656 RepID=UPI0022FE4723|nr:uncharacterized protein BDB00DRAFT_885946 [Zychaea mexicana]KAI9499554.1 hypothetical protein BDB00DRAFT_885946 [Zychaea mexicana]